jgi:hypothetical protein
MIHVNVFFTRTFTTTTKTIPGRTYLPNVYSSYSEQYICVSYLGIRKTEIECVWVKHKELSNNNIRLNKCKKVADYALSVKSLKIATLTTTTKTIPGRTYLPNVYSSYSEQYICVSYLGIRKTEIDHNQQGSLLLTS